jgi:Flp pilus assembly protein TadG
MARKWSGDDRGAALVELAFALPLLLMLLVGMVSAGVAYNNQLALTHSAREGGRYAATLPVTNFGSMEDWLEEVINQAVNDATGTLAAGVPGRSVCVAYVHPAGVAASDQTASRILDNSGLQPTQSGQQCFSDGRPDNERRVQVVVGRDIDFSVVFWSTTLNLDAEGVNRFEAALGT